MKKTVLISVMTFALALFSARAATITQSQAMDAAQRFIKSNSAQNFSGRASDNLQLAHVAHDKMMNADYYVFNLEADGGFVIVGGDDVALPVWGYSDKGSFNIDNIPDNMRVMLEEYQRQLHWLRSHTIAALRQPVKITSSVAPMITTTWDQYEPYNRYCPIFETASGYTNALSGCLATAMTQIMNYHKWPARGFGDNSYISQAYSNMEPITVSADFTQSVYQWDQMIDHYATGTYNDTQANAVARLMSDAGISIDMQYSAFESWARYVKVIEALMSNFDYSTSMQFLLKNDYSGDWDALMRTEIDNNRPVFYFGQTETNAGHAFVLDGYDTNGYFHVNWGWDGNYDGYFTTSLMRPYSPEYDPEEYNYSYDQGAIIGIQPDNTDKGGVVMKGKVEPAAATMPANEIKASFDLQALSGSYNGYVYACLASYNEQNNLYYLEDYSYININLAAGERKTFNYQASLNLNEGQTYYLFLLNPYSISVASYIWDVKISSFTVGDWPLIVGDVDGDGNVNIADVTALIDLLLSGGATVTDHPAADVDGDGSINIADVTALIDKLLSGN